MSSLQRIAIHGVPRSGTSWLGEVFNSSPQTVYRFQPLFSWAFKDDLGPESSDEQITEFFTAIAASEDPFLCQEEKRESGRLPKFRKNADPTHVVYKEVRYHHLVHRLASSEVELKLVLLVRNPLAVIHSWLNAPREFRADLGWDEAEEWRYATRKNLNRPEEFNGFEKWKEATGEFLHLAESFPERVRLVEYRDLVSDPRRTIAQLMEFCGIEFYPQTEQFIEESTKDRDDGDPYGVFRRRRADNGWQDHLDQGIVDQIAADLQGTPLARFL